jgi:aspartate 1-decarboxylase
VRLKQVIEQPVQIRRPGGLFVTGEERNEAGDVFRGCVAPRLSHRCSPQAFIAACPSGLYIETPSPATRSKENPMRWVLRSKIHKATVTTADVAYVGSITIDTALMERCGLIEGEKVLVVSNTTGARLETYTIPGAPGSGAIEMNGAAALLIGKGEEIIVMGFELSDAPIVAKCILVDERNAFVRCI